MAEVAPGGGGGFVAAPGALTSAAGRARQISAAIKRLVAAVSPASAPAASAHAGWQFGGALAASIPAWEQHLAWQAWAVSAAGGKLSSSGSRYSSAERSLAAKISSIAGMS
jgi:hypothetical protein